VFKLGKVFFSLAMLFLISPSFLFAVEEKLTITTYYPSPYGSYNQLYVASKLGIGTTSPTSPLHIRRTATDYSGPAIALKGISLAGTGDDVDGFGLYLSYNIAGNRQFVFADTATGNGVRFINSLIDGFNVGTQTRADLTFGTETNGAHVNAAVSNTQFSVSNVSGTASKIVTEIKGAASQSGNYLNISSSSGTGDILAINSSGRVGIGRAPTTYPLEVNGDASKTTAGSWQANSDRRIKTDIQDIKNATGTLKQLRPVKFKYTDEYKKKHPSIKDKYYYNFIAQEFQQVFPEEITVTNDLLPNGKNILAFDSYVVVPYLVKAIQEQQKQIETLKAEIDSLKKKL